MDKKARGTRTQYGFIGAFWSRDAESERKRFLENPEVGMLPAHDSEDW